MNSLNNYKYENLIQDQSYWPLQIIQDEYACALDIPLRIYKLSVVKNLWENEKILKEKFSSEERFHSYVKDIVINPFENIKQKLKKDKEFWQKFFTKGRETSCWLTNQSSGYFLIHSFQESPLWRWWEFFFYYNEFVINAKTSGTEYYFVQAGEHLHIAYQSISFKQAGDCLIIAGPVWIPIGNMAGSDFEEKRVKPLIISVLNINDEITIHESALIRMGNNRFPMSQDYLQNRLQRTIKAFNQVLEMSIPENYVLHRCDHVKLAEWSLFSLGLHKRLATEDCNKKEQILNILREGEPIYARLDHPEGFGKDNIVPPWVETKWDEELLPNFVLQKESPPEKNRIYSLHVELSDKFYEECKKTFENTLATFLNRIFTRRSTRKNSALLVIRKWLSDRFKIIKEEEKNKIYNDLCSWISDRIIADQVILYYYNHGKRCVKKLGFYGRTSEAEKWEKAIPDYMEKAGKKKRNNSICYRCIDTGEIKFCRMFDPETGESIPENENILEKPDNITISNRSVIATPILVFGRVWGVLEVSGIYPYQFCWNNKTFIEELVSILSPFFYQQHFLERLNKLSEVTIEHDNLDMAYQNIAHQIAVLFLSHSATLWIKSNSDYKCVGCYNPDDKLTQYIIPKNDTECENSNSEIIKGIISKKESIHQEELNFEQNNSEFFNMDWKKKQTSNLFTKLEIKHICVVPIYTVSKEVIGCFFLYSQTINNFDERWEAKIISIMRHIALLLENLDIQHKREQRNRNAIAHEMKQNADLIEDRSESLVKYIHANFNPDENHKHRMENLMRDLKVFNNDLLEDIDFFSNNEYVFKRNKNPVVLKAKSIIEREPIEMVKPSNFREQFNIEARSYWQIQKLDRTEIDYDGPPEYKQPYLKIHASNLRLILKNLLGNAFKYAFPSTLIEAKVIYAKYGLQFTISNKGTYLKEEDEFHLFEEGFRGSNTTINTHDKSGQGMGLFIVKQVCLLYGIDIRYSYAKSDNILWKYNFILSFPSKLVVTNRDN